MDWIEELLGGRDLCQERAPLAGGVVASACCVKRAGHDGPHVAGAVVVPEGQRSNVAIRRMVSWTDAQA